MRELPPSNLCKRLVRLLPALIDRCPQQLGLSTSPMCRLHGRCDELRGYARADAVDKDVLVCY